MVKIFLDDFRNPIGCVNYMIPRIGEEAKIYADPEWIVVRNFDEFCGVVDFHAGNISHISFDHDLADEHYVPEELWDDYSASAVYQADQEPRYKEKTGYECAVWFHELYKELGLYLPKILIHSMNPVGVDRIKKEFNLN